MLWLRWKCRTQNLVTWLPTRYEGKPLLRHGSKWLRYFETRISFKNKLCSKLKIDQYCYIISMHIFAMPTSFLWRWDSPFNPRPDRAFFIARPGKGRGRCDPPSVSKLSVVALSNKDQSIAQRLLAIGDILCPRSTFDLVIKGQMSIFGKIDVFQFQKIFCTIDCFCMAPVAA